MTILKKIVSIDNLNTLSEMLLIVCGRGKCEAIDKETARAAIGEGKIVCGLLDAKIPYAYSLHTMELEGFAGVVSVKFKFDISIEPSVELSDFLMLSTLQNPAKTEWSDTEIFDFFFDKCATKIQAWIAEKTEGVAAHLIKKYQSQAVAVTAEFAELTSVIPMPLKATLSDIEFFSTDKESKEIVLARSYGIPQNLVTGLMTKFVSIHTVEKILSSVKEATESGNLKFLDALTIVLEKPTFDEAMEFVSEIHGEFSKVKKFKDEFAEYGIDTIAIARNEIQNCGGVAKAFAIWRAAVDIKKNSPAAKYTNFEEVLSNCKKLGPDAAKGKTKNVFVLRIFVLAVIIIALATTFFAWNNSYVCLSVKIDGSVTALEKIFAEEFGDNFSISKSGVFEGTLKKSRKASFLEKVSAAGFELISSPDPNAFTARQEQENFSVKVFLQNRDEYESVVKAIKTIPNSTLHSQKLVEGGFDTLIADVSLGTLLEQAELSSKLFEEIARTTPSIARKDIKIVKE